MSIVYNLEPQPTAKVILHTTSGDILLELFAQQTPLTSRNFLQLCLDGYYDSTVFYRLVPGFIIQGGDPTGTGSGGQSSFENGALFADEMHSRLKFNRRGLLGMVNTGVKDDNGSQFFLTLGKTEELTGRNTMFGRVEGDTIFNLVKMGEADLVEGEGSERPMYPTCILRTEVLVNPFEDMVKRDRIATRTVETREPKKMAKKVAGKAVLSFVGDDDDEEELAPVKLAKFNSKLVSAGQASTAQPKKQNPTDVRQDKEVKERPPKRQLSRSPSPSTPKSATTKPAHPPIVPYLSHSPATSLGPPSVTNHTTLLSRTNAQIAELKSSLKREPPALASTPGQKSTLEARIPPTSTRGRKRKAGGTVKADQDALNAFNAFRKKLDDSPLLAAPPPRTNDANLETQSHALPPAPTPSNGDTMDEEATLCDLHFIANCQSCSKWDQEEENPAGVGGQANGDEDNDGWMSRQLTFAKDRLGKDLEWKRQNEQFVLIDPREREKGFKEEKRRKREVK